MKFNISHTLFRYLSKNFIRSFIIVFICLFFITSILEAIEVIRKLPHGDLPCSHVTLIQLISMQAIASIASFFPFVVFISAVVFFTIMNNKLELTTIRTMGISIAQIVKVLTFSTLILGVFYITVFDTISAFSIEEIKKIERKIFQNKDNDEKITVTNTGLWFKDIRENNMSFIIHAKSFGSSSNNLTNISFFEFDKNLNFKRSIYAKKATIVNKNWIIENSTSVDTSGVAIDSVKLQIPTNLSLQSINRMTTNPRSISFWKLSKYVSMLEKVGLSTIRYRMQWYIQISSIIQMIALIMLASIFCIAYNPRDTKIYALKVAIVLTIAFPIHFINNVFIAFGINETINIFVSTFVIPIFSIITLLIFILDSKRKPTPVRLLRIPLQPSE